jgi:hypothetical protein
MRSNQIEIIKFIFAYKKKVIQFEWKALPIKYAIKLASLIRHCCINNPEAKAMTRADVNPHVILLLCANAPTMDEKKICLELISNVFLYEEDGYKLVSSEDLIIFEKESKTVKEWESVAKEKKKKESEGMMSG